MPRYLVQRTFADGLFIPADAEGARECGAVVAANARFGVTWLHSYVSADRAVSYCVYEGPSGDAVREAAGAAGLPCDQLTEVRVLDPYFFH